MTTAGADQPEGPVDEDEAVVRYLQAVEAARAAPQGFPDPDAGGPALAGADMVTGDDREGLEEQLAASTPGSRANAAGLEDDFVKAAPGYGRRHGVTYEGWRQAGVDEEVLARAGIPAPTD
jgi:hypothetical protein